MSDTKKTDEAVIPQQASAPEKASGDREVLLKVEGLQKHFPIKKGILQRQVAAVKAVDGIDFEVRKGETLGVVGESGCGKSTMGRVITRLQDPTGGKVTFEGQDITHLSTAKMRPLRRDIQMIFQDPYGSLNPRHTIGSIVSAPFRLQGVEPEGGVKKEVQRLLSLVGLSPEHYNRYPHEFSGGQRQRIGIARALALKPKLVVADEPVSALDVSIQAQVVNLMDDLQEELGLTYVIIAHDLSVVRHVSDRVAVMYLGKIVELADSTKLYETPMHPYTKALMSAVPVPDPKRRGQKSERILLRGDVPSPIAPPSGCRFHTRCWKATEICKTTEPALLELRPGQRVACHHPENFADQAPQDTVLLTAAREASELVGEAVLEEEAKTSAAVAALEAEQKPEAAAEPEPETPDSPADAAEAPEPAAETPVEPAADEAETPAEPAAETPAETEEADSSAEPAAEVTEPAGEPAGSEAESGSAAEASDTSGTPEASDESTDSADSTAKSKKSQESTDK
ncbi:peptide/nickel transport system ATP-binding protein [Streptomyces sp. Ag109_O5-1]|uniref:dipeptide ABC transporter ATP-binding protein n=1 Tax=Streptomyces sp. Ag109_O5-1 TaxID=1938851 RepID=UPI000F4D9A5C|nr:dipeptide ABC transporter ATP-binding protein [Streptomyces sp. Ag109_O5-1]RPE40534.1 peptide/nickel transport system ATP-binding protein [Streptomyces sp. Ag109_O5-1]